ncbi:MAG: MMPL family transporter [Candidatus Omnitrophica bacterium]|nr:MMPL family transporter [Candidatus Omnitrophota bacterium]MBD3269496.1 MMPL family transporter [Candidatus Omnitrophota bacterium]
MFSKLIKFCFNHPKIIFSVTLVFVILAVIQFPRIKVDTDPENMLPEDEFVRRFHHRVKEEFGLYDFIILGIVNDSKERGVFNVDTLNKIYRITEQIETIEGVIAREIIAPSTKDNIRQGGVGEVVFEWLMKEPIDTERQALQMRDEILDNPLFNGTMVSEDGKALCIYVPIEKKDMSYRISREIYNIIEPLKGEEKYYITGLPVAEDTFGVEMFKQMAISAPLAALIIFALMFFFFKNVKLILSPMLLAIATILITMGLLIGLGFPVHIMSSMIPIFLMPIAVLDSVHILSEFFDKYRHKGNKKETIYEVIDELFTPMLYTSLTSAVGFFSLSFSPIPPVQTFGIFVAIGVMLAWFMTMTLIPAYISAVPQKSLANFGVEKKDEDSRKGIIDKFLAKLRSFSLKKAKFIIILSICLVAVSAYGISRINVNDNPVRWFTPHHRIRIADRVLNSHFGGTYTAYLVLEAEDKDSQIFKEPEMLKYIEDLQYYLKGQGVVGKSTSLADVVKKVYYELLGGDRKFNIIPDTRQAVSQTLISYENSHKPGDLWHLATPDYSKLNIWLQLKSGDNRDMDEVLEQAGEFFEKNKPPFDFSYNWAGLTFINLVWQNKMVKGMLNNFLGSFIIVFFIMTFLFRSPLRGLISMVPLTITIVFIYSLLGFIGKDYDMPVAVLSALTLGLSIDFAIHFIQRSREIFANYGNWEDTSFFMFKGPSRAIARNALVVAIGFLPLLAAPLVPYRTVGFFMFAIMFISGVATLIILPALITVFPSVVFGEEKKGFVCKCSNCIALSLGISVAVIYLMRGYLDVGWKPVLFLSIGVVVLLSGICSKISGHKFCIKEGGPK